MERSKEEKRFVNIYNQIFHARSLSVSVFYNYITICPYNQGEILKNPQTTISDRRSFGIIFFLLLSDVL